VLDIFSIKPIDRDGIIANAQKSNSTILTIEDHYIEGGINGKQTLHPKMSLLYFLSSIISFTNLFYFVHLEAVCHAVSSLGSIKVFGIAVDSVPRSGTPE